MDVEVQFVNPPAAIQQSSLAGYRARPISLDGKPIPPTWGKVIEVYDDSTVDVELSSGAKLFHVAVPSDGYVVDQKDQYNNKVLGGKRLPPKGAKVLVAFPDGIVKNAIIIASGFTTTSKNQQAELLADDEAKIDRSRNEAGLLTEYNQEDGIFTLTDDDNTDFKFVFDKKNKKITLVDWSKNKVTIDDQGMILEDKNNNKTTMYSNGIKLEDKNGNDVTMGTTSVTINGNFEVLQ